MATHSSILAWRISWTEEAGGLQSRGRKESDTTERLRFTCISQSQLLKFQQKWNSCLNVHKSMTLYILFLIIRKVCHLGPPWRGVGCPVVKIPRFLCWRTKIPGQGTKIPSAELLSQKKIIIIFVLDLKKKSLPCTVILNKAVMYRLRHQFFVVVLLLTRT